MKPLHWIILIVLIIYVDWCLLLLRWLLLLLISFNPFTVFRRVFVEVGHFERLANLPIWLVLARLHDRVIRRRVQWDDRLVTVLLRS